MEEIKQAHKIDVPCPYCGQYNMVVIGGEWDDFTKEEKRDLGAKHCNCDEAKEYQRAFYAKVDAESAVEKLFEEESLLFKEFLHEAVKVVSANSVSKVTAVNEDGIKAIVSAKGNSIQVERVETLKRVMVNGKEKGVNEE